MKQTKHTPGPWHRNIKPATKYVTIYAGRNKHICNLSPGEMTPDEAEANLNLIKSAPTLLEACQFALIEYRCMKDALDLAAGNGCGNDDACTNMLTFAIAKAEGK